MGGGIRPELVGDQSPRGLALTLQHPAKEPLSSSLVPPFGDQDVQDVAILVNSPPKIKLLSLDSHEELVHVPDVTASPLLAS